MREREEHSKCSRTARTFTNMFVAFGAARAVRLVLSECFVAKYVNMMMILGFCEENCNEAARVYAARFADITHPSPGVLRRMMVRARETGSLISTAGPDLGRPLEIVPEADELIIQLIQEDPTRSTRGIAQD
ncbi:unnamed protein product [Brassicogethes aeneus]|uniref:DUF4817 domain-containing protein n=1 Tax=Brassicogethes aeneus TaxID=1431903 RepID=A0A9P0BD64_BRAAE|nr:unnamed protein product [Brassicogethes aeneus]